MHLEIDELKRRFDELYGHEARIFRAPGRVNLIGEHTDYNEGFVLPFAIDREARVAGAVRDDTVVRIRALDIDESFEFDLSHKSEEKRPRWANYVEGTVRCLQPDHNLNLGADLALSSSVPIGAGLSSSAAIEVSIGYAMLTLNGIEIDKKKLAFAAQTAEHEFVGIRSGIMDQFTSASAREGHALLLDCRSLDLRHIPLKIENTLIAVCDTKVKHELASSAYNDRRAACEKGVETLKRDLPAIRSLRDVTIDELATHAGSMPQDVYRRCRHVVTENARTLLAAEFLEQAKADAVGELMFRSHESLRDDYEVSCRELDTLVEHARGIAGVFGARMTGGGFGGCTVNLVNENAWDEFRAKVSVGYRRAIGYEPDIYLFEASDGASEL